MIFSKEAAKRRFLAANCDNLAVNSELALSQQMTNDIPSRGIVVGANETSNHWILVLCQIIWHFQTSHKKKVATGWFPPSYWTYLQQLSQLFLAPFVARKGPDASGAPWAFPTQGRSHMVDSIARKKSKGSMGSEQLFNKWSWFTWWLIPLSKWVIAPVINGISRVNPLITEVITHLLSGMSHQVGLQLLDLWSKIYENILQTFC